MKCFGLLDFMSLTLWGIYPGYLHIVDPALANGQNFLSTCLTDHSAHVIAGKEGGPSIELLAAELP